MAGERLLLLVGQGDTLLGNEAGVDAVLEHYGGQGTLQGVPRPPHPLALSVRTCRTTRIREHIAVQYIGSRRRLRRPFVFPFYRNIFERRHLISKSELRLAGRGLQGSMDAVGIAVHV